MLGTLQDVRILCPKKVQDFNNFIWNNKDKVIYGPVDSRRLGNSLGINLFPSGKICEFRCIYCDCCSQQKNRTYAGLEKILEEIEAGFKIHQREKTPIDYITFAGNGEPTSYPQFMDVVESVLALRSRYFPNIPLAIFTNCMNLNKSEVKEALNKLDEVFFKLDAADQKTFLRINRPVDNRNLTEIISLISEFHDPKVSSAVIEEPSDFANVESLISSKFIKLLHSTGASILYLYSIDYPTKYSNITPAPLSRLSDIGKIINSQVSLPVRVLTSTPIGSEVICHE